MNLIYKLIPTLIILIATQTALADIPPDPLYLQNTTGNFWVNHTWSAGTGNITNSYNISQNGSWYNGTTNLFFNASVNPHGWSNISVYAYNNTEGGALNATPVSQNTQVPNNPPVLDSIGSKNADEGTWLNFTVHAIDADGDTITYGTNATKGSFDAGTGNFNWSVSYSDSGVYVWLFNSSDGYGGVDSRVIIITINNVPQPYTPPFPVNLQNTTGNFWVNHTWSAGTGNITNSYNISQNGSWYNGTTNLFFNASVNPHGWSNISVYAYNNTEGGALNATPVSQNTQVPNNPITISGVLSSYSLVEGQTLSIDANYSDADVDTGIFADNSTRWEVNSSTGVVSWVTAGGDEGIYYWEINVTDGYGSTSSKLFVVAVGGSSPTLPLNLANVSGNFWINWSWAASLNVDDYDVWINGSDVGADSVNLFYNGTYSAHAIKTISVRAHNLTLGNYSAWSNQTTTIPNNAPVQAAIGDKTSDELQWLNFTVSATDVDGDIMSYGTNATKGEFNTTTGNFSWSVSNADSGTYVWYFNSTDGYGGVYIEVITITINDTAPSPTPTPSGGDSGGGGGGGGGGSGAAAGEPFENVADKEVRYILTISPGNQYDVEFGKSTHHIRGLSFAYSQVADQVSAIIEKLFNLSQLANGTPPGIIFDYINIWVNVPNPSYVSNASINFCVERSWIQANSINANTIALHRFKDGGWSKLSTSKVSENETLICYIAITPGFSPFAITGEKTAATPTVTKTPVATPTFIPTPTATPIETPTPEPGVKEEEMLSNLFISGLIGGLIGFGIILMLVTRIMKM